MRSVGLLGLALWLCTTGRGEVIYRETFDESNGSRGPEKGWTQGKNIERLATPNTWHKNVLGFHGWGAPLTWTRTGGRSGGFATSESPWYLDDNHGEFYWFHLVLRMNQNKDIGIDGKDLRDATVRVSLRGRDLDVGKLKLYFWMQGEGGASSYYTKPVLFNWALTSRPLEAALRDGQWHDLSFKLTTDESQWSEMGLINGGLDGKIRVQQSRTAAHGYLEGAMKGKHWNFGFLLCNVDPRALPTGKIDIDEFGIETIH
jgi:hypothetical protein